MAENFLKQGDIASSEGRLEDAVKFYTQAIEAESNALNYCKRAEMYIKLNQFPDAHMDAEKACSLNPSDSKAFLNKGIALYHLEKFTKALESFEKGQSLCKEDEALKSWIEKCQEKINVKPKEESSTQEAFTQGAVSSPPAKQRYDWYQTDSHVVITILIKHCKIEDVQVDFTERTVSATVKLPSGSDYSLELDLAHDIIPSKSLTKILSSKIELKLRKADGVRWNKLEGDDEIATKIIKPDASDPVHKYPSSSHYTRNWDKLAKDVEEEEKKEEQKGDAAVNSLFQKIYSEGSDEVKKAMNKSFMESGGTVLSTNWSEIGNKKTEMKPPDGMEFKQWEI